MLCQWAISLPLCKSFGNRNIWFVQFSQYCLTQGNLIIEKNWKQQLRRSIQKHWLSIVEMNSIVEDPPIPPTKVESPNNSLASSLFWGCEGKFCQCVWCIAPDCSILFTLHPEDGLRFIHALVHRQVKGLLSYPAHTEEEWKPKNQNSTFIDCKKAFSNPVAATTEFDPKAAVGRKDRLRQLIPAEPTWRKIMHLGICPLCFCMAYFFSVRPSYPIYLLPCSTTQIPDLYFFVSLLYHFSCFKSCHCPKRQILRKLKP